MTSFDLAVLAVLGVSAGVGAWRGLVGEAIALVAWIVALVSAWFVGPLLADSAFSAIREPSLRMLAGFGSVVIFVLVAMALVKFLLRRLLKALGLSLTDRVLGLAFGLLRGLAIVLVLVAAGGLTSLPKQAWWTSASLALPLETVVLAMRPLLPPDLAKRIRY